MTLLETIFAIIGLVMLIAGLVALLEAHAGPGRPG